MKITNKKFYLLILSFLFIFNSFSAETLPLPEKTSIINQTEGKEQNCVIIRYNCFSKLKIDEILSFYRQKFNLLGLSEVKGVGDESKVYFFEKHLLGFHTLRSVFLRFEKETEDGIYFTLEDMQNTKLAILPFSDFYPPKTVDFMPTYQNSVQFVYNTYFSPMIGMAYLSFDEPDQIANFYIKNMPSFGWQLESNNSNSGVYSVYDWLAIIDPYTKVIPQMQISKYDEIIPPLKIRGQTLVFKKNKQSCTITIYKFDDIVEKAKNTIWDAEPIERYGNCLICVYYFSS